jgi:hypothetical protein
MASGVLLARVVLLVLVFQLALLVSVYFVIYPERVNLDRASACSAAQWKKNHSQKCM